MRKVILTICAVLSTLMAAAQSKTFNIAVNGNTATIVTDDQDWKGVIRAANDLGDDVRKVCGTASPVVNRPLTVLSISSTPIIVPFPCIGRTISDSDALSQAICPGN